jgi:hypothetical protein
MNGDVDGDGDGDGVDEDDAEASKIQEAAAMVSCYEFPIQIPSECEVTMFR